MVIWCPYSSYIQHKLEGTYFLNFSRNHCFLNYYSLVFFNEKEKAPWEMSNQERLEAAGKKKEEGNLLFKKGKHQQAGKKYDKVTECEFLFPN